MTANAAAVQEGRRNSEMQSKVEFLAHHDALTGLSNRFAFDQQLLEAQRTLPETGGRLCVLFVDLDGFKSINDTLGHAVGDALLQDVARRFSEALGREDFIARLGGDEFGVIHINGGDSVAVERLAERLIQSAAACNTVDGYEVVVSASVGIGIGADELSDPFTLVRQADLAMYHAKSSDRGQFRLFAPDMESSAQRRRDLEINLRKAFTSDELELHYQPIVDLATGRVVCLEALMRWTHPKHGPVSPDEFIGLAEEIGLINPMGEWALRRACADAAQWPSQWRLAVNISPRQFRNSGLLATVVGALAASGLRPNRLELEITESLFLDGNAETVQTLKALRSLGVRVVLDDFGIGCAGLSYLRSFRFDGLKIDKSFVQTMSKDRASAAIVRSAIGLGVSLG